MRILMAIITIVGLLIVGSAMSNNKMLVVSCAKHLCLISWDITAMAPGVPNHEQSM